MKFKKLSKKNGFSILAVILVIVAVIVAIGIWALSGQTNTSSSGTLDTIASSLQNDGNSLKTHYYELIAQGIDPTKIDFIPNASSTPPNINFYDSSTGSPVISVNKNILRDDIVVGTAGEGYWIFGRSFANFGVGALAGADPSFVLAGIKDTVCQRINQNINGTASNAAVPIMTNSGGTLKQVLNLATPSSARFTTVLLPRSNVISDGWTSGCVNYNAGIADYNMFFVMVATK